MGDVEEMVKWIKNNLGENTSLHFLRFFPHYKVKDIPSTPIETLERAYNKAKDLGMKYVYIGNTRKENSTHCPKCGELVIKREGMRTVKNKIKEGKCPSCGSDINIGGNEFS